MQITHFISAQWCSQNFSGEGRGALMTHMNPLLGHMNLDLLFVGYFVIGDNITVAGYRRHRRREICCVHRRLFCWLFCSTFVLSAIFFSCQLCSPTLFWIIFCPHTFGLPTILSANFFCPPTLWPDYLARWLLVCRLFCQPLFFCLPHFMSASFFCLLTSLFSNNVDQ